MCRAPNHPWIVWCVRGCVVSRLVSTTVVVNAGHGRIAHHGRGGRESLVCRRVMLHIRVDRAQLQRLRTMIEPGLLKLLPVFHPGVETIVLFWINVKSPVELGKPLALHVIEC